MSEGLSEGQINYAEREITEDEKRRIATTVVHELQTKLLAVKRDTGCDFDDFSGRLGTIDKEVRAMLGLEENTNN